MGETNTKKIHVSNDVKYFSKLTWKKYKKENSDYWDSKKELKKEYYQELLQYFPDVLLWLVKFGYIKSDEVIDTKQKCYAKFNDPDFCKALKKSLKKGDKIDNIELYPIIIADIITLTAMQNEKIKNEDANAPIYDMSDMIEISKMILKKKLKKFAKNGIEEAIAFDLLSVIPDKKALSIRNSQFFRIKTTFDILYEHAKNSAVDFNKIVKIIIPFDFVNPVIIFSLLERKDKFSKLNDTQKKLYVDITNWCFDVMEKELKPNEIEYILEAYANARKNDDAKGKDSNRRYVISSLSDQDYKNISKVVKRFITDHEDLKKYI